MITQLLLDLGAQAISLNPAKPIERSLLNGEKGQ